MNKEQKHIAERQATIEAIPMLPVSALKLKRFISFSGGVESTTMCILYGKGATAIWCDTGAEHEEMYNKIDSVEQRLKELHNGDFELVRVKNEKHNGLEEYANKAKYMPSGQARYCTRMFKIEPIDDFLGKQGECELMIGFNYDEQGRTGNLELKTNVKYSYPLIEDGLTRDDCEDILKLNNLHPKFPVYMLRGGCRMCFYKSEKEYRAMYHLNKTEFEKMIEFEEGMQDERLKFYSIMGNGKSLRQLATECKSEMFVDVKSLYDDYKKDGKSCGAFCRR
jgi:3'-phosphoadenosine 5'-phosphosulfate sulfotransferase (PAPS reductase)/FAD synthetase